MKTISLLTLLLLLSIKSFSQDTLFTKDGRIINGKVIEIRPNQVKYKSQVDAESQYSLMDLSEIKTIHYASGATEIFSETSNANPGYTPYNVAPSNDTTKLVQGAPDNIQINNNYPDPSYGQDEKAARRAANVAVGVRMLGLAARIAVAVLESKQCHNQQSYYHNNSYNSNRNNSEHWRGH